MMTDAEVARSHGRQATLDWHRDRAEAARVGARNPAAEPAHRAYWNALAAWHDSQAEGYLRALRQEITTPNAA